MFVNYINKLLVFNKTTDLLIIYGIDWAFRLHYATKSKSVLFRLSAVENIYSAPQRDKNTYIYNIVEFLC
jgi:hypothetical protein